MKKLLSITLAAAVMWTSTSCLGEFALTKGLLNFNRNITDSKFVNNLLFYGLALVQAYSVAVFIDVVILNLIEFWTGSNPAAMNEGEFERQVIPFQGEEYIVEATQNQFKIYQDGQEPTYLRFSHEDNSWTAMKADQSQKLISYHESEEGGFYHIYKEDGVLSLKADYDYSKGMLDKLFTSTELTAMK